MLGDVEFGGTFERGAKVFSGIATYGIPSRRGLCELMKDEALGRFQ